MAYQVLTYNLFVSYDQNKACCCFLLLSENIFLSPLWLIWIAYWRSKDIFRVGDRFCWNTKGNLKVFFEHSKLTRNHLQHYILEGSSNDKIRYLSRQLVFLESQIRSKSLGRGVPLPPLPLPPSASVLVYHSDDIKKMFVIVVRRCCCCCCLCLCTIVQVVLYQISNEEKHRHEFTKCTFHENKADIRHCKFRRDIDYPNSFWQVSFLTSQTI